MPYMIRIRVYTLQIIRLGTSLLAIINCVKFISVAPAPAVEEFLTSFCGRIVVKFSLPSSARA